MAYIQEIYLDINPNNSYTVVTTKQYDADSRGILAHITKDGQQYQITGSRVVFRMHKPDGHIVVNDAVINSDNTVTAVFTQQCLIVSGRAYADLAELDASGTILSTASFIVDIRPSPNPNAREIESSDEYRIVYDFIMRAQDVLDSVREWIDGHHGSQEIGPDNPAYHNNAKYWAYRAKNVAESMSLAVSPETGMMTVTFEEP